MVNVLITSAGVESAVNIIKSLRMQNEILVKIFAVDIDKYASRLLLADEGEIAPLISNGSKYLQFILHFCKKMILLACSHVIHKRLNYLQGILIPLLL